MIRKIITAILAYSILLSGAVVFAKTQADPAISKTETVYNEDNTNIMVSADKPQFTITLKANPTTGYSWFLREYDASLIQPVGNQYHAPNKGLIGASGYDVWTFKVKPAGFAVPHQTTLRMVYARPWNKSDSGTQLVFHVSTTGAHK